MLVERNLDTTKWPKMDLTNCRSMELFRRIGISEGLREIGELLKQSTCNSVNPYRFQASHHNTLLMCFSALVIQKVKKR